MVWKPLSKHNAERLELVLAVMKEAAQAGEPRGLVREASTLDQLRGGRRGEAIIGGMIERRSNAGVK